MIYNYMILLVICIRIGGAGDGKNLTQKPEPPAKSQTPSQSPP